MHHQEFFVSLGDLAHQIRIAVFGVRIDRIVIIQHIPHILLDKKLVQAPLIILLLWCLPGLFNHRFVDLVNFVLVESAFDAIDDAVLLRALVLLD